MPFGQQISPEDLHWEGEEPGVARRISRGGPGRGVKKGAGRGGAMAGRGRGVLKGQPKKDLPPSQNGIGKKGPEDIEILDTGSLIKEVQAHLSLDHSLSRSLGYSLSHLTFWCAGGEGLRVGPAGPIRDREGEEGAKSRGGWGRSIRITGLTFFFPPPSSADDGFDSGTRRITSSP